MSRSGYEKYEGRQMGGPRLQAEDVTAGASKAMESDAALFEGIRSKMKRVFNMAYISVPILIMAVVIAVMYLRN